MTKPIDGSSISEDNYVPVKEDKIKDEQKNELAKALEAYKHECLKSFCATKSGEVFKKFDFPTLQPLTETQHENKMLDMVHQAVGQAFVNHAPVMTHTVHNTVIKTLGEGPFQGYIGPCYMQPSQMNFTPMGSTTTTVPSSSVSRPEGNTGPMFSQPTGTIVPPQMNPAFTTSPSIAATVQGGFASEFSVGWDPVTGFGMPPQFFTSSGTGQVNPSASMPMAHQQSTSASQPMMQNASATQPTG